jgi:hypothetical protein
LGTPPLRNCEIPLNRSHFAGTNAKAENYRRQQGSSVVPLFRYFLVMGCCLLGLLFAFDYLTPKEAAPAVKAEAAVARGGGSLASWRQSQERLDKPQTAPVVYPDLAPLPPTAERLQWERQLTFRKADTPATPSLQARAELPPTAAETIAPPAPVKSAAEAIAPPTPVKSAAKTPSRHKSVARVERRERGYDRPNYAAAYPPAPVAQYGGYRQAQFDRPFGGFFGRMF